MSKIKSIQAYEILASDGFPTIKCKVTTDEGFSGSAAVSYGASAGSHEAAVLTDNDEHRYQGKGVLGMCQTIEEVIAPKLLGMSVFEQKEIDQLMIEMDGTERKEKLGGNTILAVSMAWIEDLKLLEALILFGITFFAFSFAKLFSKFINHQFTR